MKKKIKKVLVTGLFNVLHPGHMRLLRFAKECGDYLIVGVTSDSASMGAAHVGERLRLEGVQGIQWVDESFLAYKSVQELIKEIKPDLIVKGKEFEFLYNPELEVLDEYGGKLLFSSGEIVFSSIDLIRKEFFTSDRLNLRMPTDYMSRHQISAQELRESVKRFSKLTTLVLGDLIVDEYISCEPLGMSQEDPTIVVTPIDRTRFVGGAGIVAAHAAGLNSKAYLISVVGNDEVGEYVKTELNSLSVKSWLLIDEDRPTTLKQRYRSNGKSLLRVSHLHQGAISIALQERILSLVVEVIDKIDVLIFSDFNYGALPQNLVERITALAKKNRVMISADSQSSSQVGNIARFKGADLLTPTEHELRISLQNKEDGLVVLAENLRKKSSAKNILLKLGAEGLLVQPSFKKKGKELVTDRLPALNANPRDVAGAGDSLLITTSLAIKSGLDIWNASLLGCVAAGIQVSRVGNIPITSYELINSMDHL